jgi:uncharacterized protein YceK
MNYVAASREYQRFCHGSAKVILAVTLLGSVSGCATTYTLAVNPHEFAVKNGCADDAVIPYVYSGVSVDLTCLRVPIVGLFCLIDLPLSAALDTVILPYTIYKQKTYGNWYTQEQCQREIEWRGGNP